jgi:hypothetical protein
VHILFDATTGRREYLRTCLVLRAEPHVSSLWVQRTMTYLQDSHKSCCFLHCNAMLVAELLMGLLYTGISQGTRWQHVIDGSDGDQRCHPGRGKGYAQALRPFIRNDYSPNISPSSVNILLWPCCWAYASGQPMQLHTESSSSAGGCRRCVTRCGTHTVNCSSLVYRHKHVGYGSVGCLRRFFDVGSE